MLVGRFSSDVVGFIAWSMERLLQAALCCIRWSTDIVGASIFWLRSRFGEGSGAKERKAESHKCQKAHDIHYGPLAYLCVKNPVFPA